MRDRERATRLRLRAAEFQRLAEGATDPVIHEELSRLAILYNAQADMVERGEKPPADPGDCD
jgi:hypothetical protein